MNISSFVVHVQPAALAAVLDALRALDGLEVQGSSPAGQVVVTLESETDAATLAGVERLAALDGVMSVAMAYHQIEDEPDLEVRNGTDPT